MITKAVWEQLLAAACAGVLCVILTAGLWPFTPHPKNEVAWLENGNGIHFGAHGTMLSSGAFQPVDPAAGTACSLEMWAEAGPKNQAGTLLGFYSPEQPFSFSIYQYRNGLVFEHKPGDRPWHVGAPGSGVDDVFHPGGPSFVTITANSRGTEIYLDGALVERSPLLRLSSRDFTGQLAVGTSPVGDESWSGEIRGLAIFDRELSAAEVLEHYDSWSKNGRPQISGNESPVALYLFDERAGSVVHNRAGSAPDLTIPDHYMIFRHSFLEWPWKEYHPDWTYYQDILVNIVGFIPLGFVFCACLSSVRNLRRARLIAILIGFAVSLTIEVLQAYIPSRGSGMTDVITNTLGTAIGAIVFQSKITYAIFSAIGIPTEH